MWSTLGRFRHSVTFKIAAVLAGPGVVIVVLNIVSGLLPLAYHTESWSLYPLSLGGFIGAFLGAWSLEHGRGWLYGLALGALVGVPLCLLHESFAFMDGSRGPYCQLIGDRVAGLLFGLLSGTGGYLGTVRSGAQPYLVKSPVSWTQVVLVVVSVLAYVGIWLAALLTPEIFIPYL